MTGKLAQWGNSVALRLPKSITDQARLSVGDELEIVVEKNGQIVLRPKRPRYTLEELLAGVTKDNQHPVVDWGQPVGKEVW